MPNPQPGILRPPPPTARFVTFALSSPAHAREAVAALAARPHDGRTVWGFGAPLLSAIGASVDGLRPFPDRLPPFPSTQAAAWLVLAHPTPDAIFDAGRQYGRCVAPALVPVEEIDAFAYRGGRDLSGFEDGTENPKGKKAAAAAIVSGRGKGIDGGSFVAVQRWRHDLAAVEAMSEGARDATIGRRRKGNAEIADAPASAHIKRTQQEAFEPPAFILRRSLTWGGIAEHGLYFVAYGATLDAFERQLIRMSGHDDGIVDGLFSFSRALTGGYYFCPPLEKGRLDLRAFGVPR
jgi:putative iron-dependent peroxidase